MLFSTEAIVANSVDAHFCTTLSQFRFVIKIIILIDSIVLHMESDTFFG